MSSLAIPIARAQRRLDTLTDRAVIVDSHGDAWQHGSVGSHDYGHWYRAYDGEGRSSWEAAQIIGPDFVVIKGGVK